MWESSRDEQAVFSGSRADYSTSPGVFEAGEAPRTRTSQGEVPGGVDPTSRRVEPMTELVIGFILVGVEPMAQRVVKIFVVVVEPMNPFFRLH